MEPIDIRESHENDTVTLMALYHDAFPGEDLVPLVTDLLADDSDSMSLVASMNAEIVGHVIFSPCRTKDAPQPMSLLGPLAVANAVQKQGIGTALVRAGMERLENADVARVFVLGDPAYYSRHGFKPESEVLPPYQLPAEWDGAWQSINLGGATHSFTGTLVVPATWQRPELWSP